MSLSGPGIAVLAAGAAFVAALVIWQHVVCREQRHRDESARRRIAAREAELATTRADGSHEACELTSEEWGWPEYLHRRYPNLGKEMTR